MSTNFSRVQLNGLEVVGTVVTDTFSLSLGNDGAGARAAMFTAPVAAGTSLAYDSNIGFFDNNISDVGGSMSIVEDNSVKYARFNTGLEPTVGNLMNVWVPLAPVGGNAAASKSYVDGKAVGGLVVEAACRVSETSAAVYTYDAGTNGGTLTGAPGTTTIDGVVVAATNRVLFAQATETYQGIYEVVSVSPIVMQRVSTMAIGDSVLNNATLVLEGTAHASITYVQTENVVVDALTPLQQWVEFSVPGVLNAGDGITIAAGVVSANILTSDFSFTGSQELEIKTGAITAAKLAAASVTNAAITDSTISGTKLSDTTVANAKLANSALTVGTTSPLQGGGSVALGNSITLTLDMTGIVANVTHTTTNIPVWTNAANPTLADSTFTITGNALAGIANSSVTATSILATSDSRLKDGMCMLADTSGIDALNAYSYHFKADDCKKERFGVLAQDLVEIYPQLVHQGADGYYAVDYNGLVSVLLQHVKGLSAKIDALVA